MEIHVVDGLRFAAAVSLMVLPGAWLGFSFRSLGLNPPGRACLSVVLSPVVLVLQFYILRLGGLPFTAVPVVLVLLNLFSLLRVGRFLQGWKVQRLEAAAFAGSLVLPLIFLSPHLVDAYDRMFSGHAWWHMDVVYQIANGALIVEEPELAGVRMAYAWPGHVFQAVVSWLMDSPPAVGFFWTNIVWLLALYGLVWTCTARLGGGLWARSASLLLLSFGVNAMGYGLSLILARGSAAQLLGPAYAYVQSLLLFGGDWRFTPWLLYFFFFHQIIFALGMVAAIAHLCVGLGESPHSRPIIGILFLLLIGVGLTYPILFPAAASVPLAWMATQFSARPQIKAWVVNVRPLALMVFAAALVSVVHLRFVSADRAASTIGFQTVTGMLGHAVLLPVVLSPLLLGVVLFHSTGCGRSRESLTLLLSGAASMAVYVLLAIPGGGLEYKFIFTAAICLSPLAACGFEHLVGIQRGRRVLVLATLVVSLFLPGMHKLLSDGWTRDWIPALSAGTADLPLNATSFFVRPASGDPWSAPMAALREGTSPGAVMVALTSDAHLPTLTAGRVLYVAPIESIPYRGINVPVDEMLRDMRGYDPTLIDGRRATVQQLFTAADSPGREVALASILTMDRETVILTQPQRDADFERWLAGRGQAVPLYRDGRIGVWLVAPLANESKG